MKEATGNYRRTTSTLLAALLGGILTLSAASISYAGPVGAFNYNPITEPILSATFSADFAALTAHRTVLGQEVNMAMLLDISTGLPDFDMSDDLFGTAAWPAPAGLDQGSLGTGIVSAAVDPSFFPALESGSVGLWFLATDTNDALFAIDFLSLSIDTASGTTVSFHGPLGDSENNGFGIALPDGGDLPGPMPGALSLTGTGFDEEISSKSIHIPEPGSFILLVLGVGVAAASRRIRGFRFARARVVRNALLILAVLGFLGLVSNAQAGFDWGKDANKNKYRKGPLSAAQKMAIQCAIDEINNMANTDPSAKNKRTMKRIATCLQAMLKAGRICTETANKAKAATTSEKPRKCTWTGDKINIKPGCIAKTEPTFSLLIAAFVHEGIHAIQWRDGSGLADTLTEEEWVAYSWTVYILCRRLAEQNLTEVQKDKIKKKKAFWKWVRDALCDKSLSNSDRKKKLKECNTAKLSTAAPSTTYSQRLGQSAVIDVDVEGGTSFEIMTPFARTFDLAIGSDGTGDILIVCGVDGSGSAGGVVMYFDADGDGLADQSTETVIGSIPQPLDLAFVGPENGLPSQLFVLDIATHNVFVALGDAMGRPTSLEVTPFVSAASFPFMANMFSVTGGGGTLAEGISIIVSELGEEVDQLDAAIVDYELIDSDLDLVADASQSVEWSDSVVSYVPTFLTDVQNGDESVQVAGMSNTTLVIHITDADVSFLGEQLGQLSISLPDHASEVTVPLSRPLNSGEFVVVVDNSTGEHENAGTLVTDARPEITTTDRTAYFPGEEVNVFGRNFGGSPVVTVSGDVVTAVALSDSHLVFTAPNVTNVPTNLFVIEVDVGGAVSNIAGVQFIQDANVNGIRDACEVPDQLHILGADPNERSVGETVSIEASVQAGFVGIPRRPVVFTKLSGSLTFTDVTVSPDGTQATTTTDANGTANITFVGDAPGSGLIEVTVPGTALITFSFFEIVTPPAPLLGDINGDGVIDGNDTNLFIAVLLGTDTDPNHVTASDCNGDGAPNGKDIQAFVSSLAGL